MKRTLLLCVLAVVGAGKEGPARAQSPQEVFKQASPSIVLVRDSHSFGSGVVLDQSGLIITNFHVVALPLPLEVTAIASRGDKTEQATFKDVKIVGVHPQYDLALLQVAAGDAKLVHVRTGRKEALETGEACYAIGSTSSNSTCPRPYARRRWS